MNIYTVQATADAPKSLFQWDDWADAETASITNFRPETADFHPVVESRLKHDDANLYGIFRVQDRYIRVVHTHYQDQVCQDSCAEFFFQPDVGTGYFNLEMNAGGTFLFYHVTRPRRFKGDTIEYEKVAPEHAALMEVHGSMPKIVEPEISEPRTWFVQFRIPMAAIEPYIGPVGSLNGRKWRGNFYQCSDKCSHPRWTTWNPIPETNYHMPEYFGEIDLA